MSENEIGLREGRAKFGDLVNRAEYSGQTTYVTRHGRRVAAIVPIHLIPQECTMTTFQILASNGSEEPSEGPAWLIVDDSDSVIVAAPFKDGDTIDDAIARFVEAGELPEGAQLERQERMHDPYSWQPSGYAFRWTVTAPE
ncbi:type II toxin-antitoxin system Phd/YefM family antitoxin [Nonomuraea sp. NPDC049714]|uniref:type II toxin-antitoxin system Phd/YefM family antitoxin n=1 Tax=Nonomuraea sp. NPDC049714 TaxID=3364357 RepID=UPI0037929F7E